MSDHLNEIIGALSDAGVNFIICGGLAVVLHGGERVTMDIDIATDFDQANIKKFLSVMARFDLVPRAPVDAEILLNREAIETIIRDKHALVFSFINHKQPWLAIDVFLTPEMAYSRLIPDCTEVLLSGKKIPVLSPEKLLSLKMQIDPPRDKDLFDINFLQKLLRKNEK